MHDAFSAETRNVRAGSLTFRLPNVVAPYARRTTRLGDLLTLIGFAMGGEAGNCLVERMGLEASPETLLRLVRQQEERQVPTPRVLGVDDFCSCRRRSYGAVLIDLERRVPIDLLPDREAETFKKWLLAHPGVEIISRDRGGSFARSGQGRERPKRGRSQIAGTYSKISRRRCRASFSSRAISAPVLEPEIGSRSAARGQTARASPLAYRDDEAKSAKRVSVFISSE